MQRKYRLLTNRLGLRGWTDEDLEPFAKMNSDINVMRYFQRPLSLAETRLFIVRIQDHFVEHGFGLYAVDELISGRFIGFIGFQMATFDAAFTPCIEIGWRLSHAFWGRGYATEGATACLRAGFTDSQFPEVVSFTSEINQRSISVMKKIGLKYRMNFMHPAISPDHELANHVLYGITRDQYEREISTAE
jgi:ribosomal-protein-alanine N-acetyltransferase